MFNFLKGNQETLKITLDRPSGIYFPGENLQATISVETSKEIKIQEGRVALVCLEEYEYSTYEQTTDSDGNSSRTLTTSTVYQEHEFGKDLFLLEGTLAPDAAQTFPFSVQLPEPALPSLPGKIVRVRWLVKATLARKLAADIHAETELMVASPISSQPETGRYGQSTEPTEILLSFDLPGIAWLAGETITGNLIMAPEKKFEATEIRLELVEFENVPLDQGNQHENTIKVKLAGKTRFEPGQPLSLPFQIQIPPLCQPSAAGENWSVSWKLKAVLARFLRKDTLVEQEIQIYTGRKG